MDYTPKDLGEVPKVPDMTSFKNPLEQQSSGNIFIESFNITTLTTADKSESLTEIIKKESKDSCI
ncbi:hypothetical protein [Flavobacterium sp.]|jgi:hypothetical protein|uniref:hypothetical protein n=1 Tax=Flavobacterium sp. TaxID=239 RepID=UPI002EDA304F